MTTTTRPPFPVTPRRSGEPEPDLTGFTLIHRAMRAGTRSLAAAVTTDQDERRRRAVLRFGRELIAEIHQHREREDDVLWPVIAASAGAGVDLRPLSDDHAALAPLLDRIDGHLDRYEAGDPATAPVLHAALRELAELLDEHITEEEALAFPVVRRHVSVGDLERCERLFRKGTSLRHMAFLLPFVIAQATPDERAECLAEAGLPLRVLLRLTTPRYDRLVAELG